MLKTDIRAENNLVYSPIDSHRFNLKIYRMHAVRIDGDRLRNDIIRHEMDTAIIRINSRNLSSLDSLIKTGMPFMVADTLIYYHLNLDKHKAKPLFNPELKFIAAHLEHHPILNRVVKNAFSSYSNHYRNNPIFNDKLVDVGYQDWVNSYAVKDANKRCLLVSLKGEYVGFITFKIIDKMTIEGVLYGVLTNYRRQNIFKDIIQNLINYALANGYKYIRAICQIENTNTQRVWLSQGFRPLSAINTIHINAMLSKTIIAKFELPFEIKKDARAVKDLNANILKVVNQKFDLEQNITTYNHRFVNLKELIPDSKHTLVFSLPQASLGLAKLIDDKGQVVVLIYFYLKHFLT